MSAATMSLQYRPTLSDAISVRPVCAQWRPAARVAASRFPFPRIFSLGGNRAWSWLRWLNTYLMEADEYIGDYLLSSVSGGYGFAQTHFESAYAHRYPQPYQDYKKWRRTAAGTLRGNEGVLATTSSSALGLGNAYAYFTQAEGLHHLTVAAMGSRIAVFAGMKIGALLGITALTPFLAMLAPYAVIGSLMSVAAVGVVAAINAYRQEDMSKANKAMAFGAAALGVTALIPGLDFLLPYVAKPLSFLTFGRQLSTIGKNQGQWLKDATLWQKTLMIGSMAASAAIMIPTLWGAGQMFGILPAGHPAADQVAVTPMQPMPAPANMAAHSYAAIDATHANSVENVTVTARETMATASYHAPEPVYGPSPYHQTSGFGERIDPFSGHISMHRGRDFGAPLGTAVPAVNDGTVVVAGPCRGFGHNYVVIETHVKTASGWETVKEGYGHMKRMFVHVGDTVLHDQKIGLVGSEGRSTGSHLHFGAQVDGNYVDPYSIAPVRNSLTDCLFRHFDLGRHNPAALTA